MSDEFMFGDYLLVCPITEPMYYEANSVELVDVDKTWDCYLPEGNAWYDYWTNERYEGGQTVKAQGTIDTMPLFVKEGDILIKEEALQYANETVTTPLHVYIYTGADAEFLYYEDDGDSYRYENGEFNEIPFTWNEECQELTIGAATKTVATSIVGRELIIHVGNEEIQVQYTGACITIK